MTADSPDMTAGSAKHTEAMAQPREARQPFLFELNLALQPLGDPLAIKTTATRLLGTQLQANRAAYFEVADDHYVIEGGYCHGTSAIDGRHPVTAFGTDLYQTFCSGRTACDCDTEANPELSTAERAGFAALDKRAYIGVPVVKDGAFIAGLDIHCTEPRNWTLAQIELAETVAERTWAAIERSRARTVQAKSDDKYQALFNSTAEGWCIAEVLYDQAGRAADHRIIEVNAAFERHTGLSDSAGQRASALMPGVEQFWNDIYARVSASGSNHKSQQYSAAFDRFFDIEVMPLGEPGSNQVAVRFSDITDRTRAHATRARLAAIVESSDDAIISKDLGGTIESWNPAAEQLFGYTAAEAVGQSITLLMPADRVAEEEAILRQIRAGTRIEHFETVRQCKDGTLLDVSLTISPIADSAGQITGASKIARDISERRRIERLREQQTRLLELIASGAPLNECLNRLCQAVPQISAGMRASILIADATRQAFEEPIAPNLQASWNDELTGAPINELRIGTCGEAVCRGHPVTCADVTTDDRWSAEWRALCQANGVMAAYSVPVWDEDGHAVASFMLCFDRARAPSPRERELAEFGSRIASIALARTRANEALRAAGRRKDEFLATLAHELRNPLAPLHNGLRLLRQDDAGNAEKAGDMMARQLAQLTRLMDDLLDAARITHEKVALRIGQTDLATVLEDAMETARPQVDAGGHTMHTRLPDGAITLQADRQRLTQVFINLINNAAAYTPGPGQIELIVRRRDNVAEVIVRDNGMGIAANRLGAIFDMFVQNGQPKGQASEGLGIGLTLARQVVALHGGTVEAHSQGPGQGSDFNVHLPLGASGLETTTDSQPTGDTPDPLRVLTVDDNEDVADSLQLLLESMGHDARIAHDGYQALDTAGKFQPHVVFLDLGMPGIDGLETARRLRATPEGQETFLIALTGWGQASDRHRTTEAGFDRHVVKPIDPDVLEQMLAELKH